MRFPQGKDGKPYGMPKGVKAPEVVTPEENEKVLEEVNVAKLNMAREEIQARTDAVAPKKKKVADDPSDAPKTARRKTKKK